LDEVAAVIEGKLVAGKQVEIKEVKNAYEAYDRILTFDPYSVKDFLKAHKMMRKVQTIPAYSSSLRSLLFLMLL
jgi:Fic family protein